MYFGQRRPEWSIYAHVYTNDLTSVVIALALKEKLHSVQCGPKAPSASI